MIDPVADSTPLEERKLAPDLARGFMLLFVAVARVHLFLYGYGFEVSFADQVVVLVRQTLIDAQAYPLFFLFGYGMVQLMHRQEELGGDWISIRGLLRRRGLWMVLIGFLHATLLFPPEVIAGVGIATLS